MTWPQFLAANYASALAAQMRQDGRIPVMKVA